jgi:hypothetical protein
LVAYLRDHLVFFSAAIMSSISKNVRAIVIGKPSHSQPAPQTAPPFRLRRI